MKRALWLSLALVIAFGITSCTNTDQKAAESSANPPVHEHGDMAQKMPADHPPMGDDHPPMGGDHPPMAGDHPPAGGMNPMMGKSSAQLVVPDDVKAMYSSVKLKVAKKDGQGEQVIEAKIGAETKLAETGLTVNVVAFLPAFYMDAERISSVGTDPKNPAAKVEITEKGQNVYTGWLFANMPEVHRFEHPNWSVTLAEGVANGAAPAAGGNAAPPSNP